MHACIWTTLKTVHVYVVRIASVQCPIYHLRSKTPTGRNALSISLKKKKHFPENLDKLMSPKSCTCNHEKILQWNAIFFMEYYGHARSWRHSLEEIYATLYPENISPVTYAFGERKHINSACDTAVHSIRVECARVQPPFRPVYIHSAPSCGVPIT